MSLVGSVNSGRYSARGRVQFQIKHLLIATTAIAATLAVSPFLTAILALLLVTIFVVNLFLPRRHSHKDSSDVNQANRQLFRSSTGLFICVALFLFSVGLPITQALIYQISGWHLQLWLLPQLSCYVASLVLLSFAGFDSHEKYEYRVIVTIFYIVFVPPTIIGVTIWNVIST